jgi:hypothetical protein
MFIKACSSYRLLSGNSVTHRGKSTTLYLRKLRDSYCNLYDIERRDRLKASPTPTVFSGVTYFVGFRVIYIKIVLRGLPETVSPVIKKGLLSTLIDQLAPSQCLIRGFHTKT